MSAKVLAKVLLKMLEEDQFAAGMIADPMRALAPFKDDLSQAEYQSLTASLAPKDVPPLQAVPYVGAWKVLAENIEAVDKKTKDRLNAALAKRSATRIAIPVTGT